MYCSGYFNLRCYDVNDCTRNATALFTPLLISLKHAALASIRQGSADLVVCTYSGLVGRK